MSDAYIWQNDEGRFCLAFQQDDQNYYDDSGDLVWDSGVVDEDGNPTPEGSETYPDHREQRETWMDYFVTVAETGDDYLGELMDPGETPAEVAAAAWGHAERIATEHGFALPERPRFVGTAPHETLYDLMERNAGAEA